MKMINTLVHVTHVDATCVLLYKTQSMFLQYARRRNLQHFTNQFWIVFLTLLILQNIPRKSMSYSPKHVFVDFEYNANRKSDNIS